MDDIDIQKKLSEWEAYYNMHRPNGSLKEHIAYEILKEKIILPIHKLSLSAVNSIFCMFLCVYLFVVLL